MARICWKIIYYCKVNINDFQSYFQLFSDPEFAKKYGIYLFGEYSNNYCKSVRSIDKLLYLEAHANQSVPQYLWKTIGKFVFKAYFYARDVKIDREDLNVFFRSQIFIMMMHLKLCVDCSILFNFHMNVLTFPSEIVEILETSIII